MTTSTAGPEMPATHAETPAADGPRLLRIHEAASEVGLTTRTVRYYEELGLVSPAARSGGDYRLYDADDLERLRYIRDLRDTAGFSLAEIGQLLEEEAGRARNRSAFRATEDPVERRGLVEDSIERIDRQIATLTGKVDRLSEMIAEARGRRARLVARVGELTAAIDAQPAGTTAKPASDIETRPNTRDEVAR